MSFYWMQVLVEWIQCWMLPLSRYLTKNRYLMALRDGFQLAMPFVIVGSICVPFLYPPFVLDNQNSFTQAWHFISVHYRTLWLAPYQITLGLVSLLVAFGMAASLAKHYGLPERLCGLTGCVSFLLLSGFEQDNGIEFHYLGGMGIFTAILASVYAIEIIRFFYQRNWTIRVPEEVPRITASGFLLIVPLFVILFSMTILNIGLNEHFGASFPVLVEKIFRPMIVASDTLVAVWLSILICNLLWFFGIHGSLLLTGIMYPFWMSNILDNQAALAANQPLPHIFIYGFWDFYLLVGGVGATLPLVFMALKSRSQQLKSAGKVGIVPALFNINEPILFGFPIIMNPVFLIPFILAPLVNATIAWYLTEWGLLDRFIAILPWSMPSPVGAALSANGSWRPTLMSIFAIVNAWIIYYPFFKVHERLLLEGEQQRQNRI
ncbi:PTS sugar transporter subunit IIC [Vibrio quintilis]|nr:PTS transporter subunit EIIC [Vibrio quintilis]